MLEVFKKFHALRNETAGKCAQGGIVKHSDHEFAERKHKSFKSFIFFDLAGNFTRGLINELTRFLLNINHADCWFQTAQKCPEKDRMGLIFEFADPLLELSVSRPYSLKNQFIFAAVHLLHYSNQLKQSDWKDDLPSDDKINFKQLDKVGLGWTSFQNFKDNIELLNSKNFRDSTRNFRHRLQHRFRSHFDVGLTPFIDRIRTENGVTYAFKMIPPLDLEALIPELYKQHQIAIKVFQAYWQLVNELRAGWAVSEPNSGESD